MDIGDDAILDGGGNGEIANNVMLGVERQVGGNQDGADVAVMLENFEESTSLFCIERLRLSTVGNVLAG